MEKLKTLIVMLLLAVTAQAQTAKEVLDKTAAVVSSKKGVTGHFNINSSNGVGMKASGTIAVKGKKFHAVTPQATIWFDGKTMWTYLKQNDEVNISTPTSSQLATINPYNLLCPSEGHG